MKKLVMMGFLALIVVVLLVVGFNGKITGNGAYRVPRSCVETDNGNDPAAQGTVTAKGLSSARLQNFTDTCKDSGTLLEHYCEDAAHLTETIPCECKDGACKSRSGRVLS
ncbi:MAG: hypothetical protein AABX05_04375 [Nanoarchaeota archaeon]